MTNLLRKALLLTLVAYAHFAAAQTRADGLTAMQLEDWDKAISIYTALTKTDPTDQDAFLTLSNAYLAKGDKAKAMEMTKAAFSAKPEGVMAHVANARVKLLENNASEATEQFKRAAGKAKKDINALRQIAESYTYYIPPGSKKPDLTRATELFKAATDLNSKDIPTLMAYGYAYKEMGNGGFSAQQYELAESLDPKNPLPKLMLAKVYKAAKLPDKALAYFDKAIAVAPNFCEALRGKAEHLYFSRKWEAATQAYKDLVGSCKEVKIEDEMQLANCLYITKDCKGTSELVEKILAKDPSKNYLRRLKAYCDYDNGDFQRSLEILNTYFKTAPQDKIIARDYEYLGKLQLKTKGDTLAALGNMKKSVEIDSSTWPLYKEIAEVYYNKRMNCESVKAYQMYFDSLGMTDPKAASDIYKFGLAQFYCKEDSLRFVHAEQTFKKVSELMPKAGIGWLWAAKSAEKQDPSPEAIELNPALANEYGKARTYYEQYVEIAWIDKEKNKKDLIRGCQYLAYCYFVKNEADKFFPMTDKWLELETDPAAQAAINEMRGAFGKETVPSTPATTPATTPIKPDGGGKGRN